LLGAEQTGGGERVVADGFGVEPEPRPAREQPVLIVARQMLRRDPRTCP
jgi:hypothetical protein